MSEDSSASASGHPDLRASDADRERLIGELQTHAIAGRLSTEEFEERTQSAYAARTTGELDALRRDLPSTAPAPGLAHREHRARLTRRMAQETGGSFSLFVLCTIIWAASGGHDHGSFWPIWVLIPVVLSAGRSAWALYGPAPDLDVVEAQLDARRAERVKRIERRTRRRLGP